MIGRGLNPTKKVPNFTFLVKILEYQFLEECKRAVDELDIKSIHNGYLCSTCDPYLILVSDIFNVNIQHKYLNSTIEYKNIKNNNNNRSIYVKSNQGHFQKN